jgi:hypothetical protein
MALLLPAFPPSQKEHHMFGPAGQKTYKIHIVYEEGSIKSLDNTVQ